MDAPPRDTRQRKRDLLARLAREREAWVSTSSPDAEPYLVPLWFPWDGTALWLSTRWTNPTGRNLRAQGDAYGYFRVLPRSIQVWRGVPERAGRWVMRDGAWAR